MYNILYQLIIQEMMIFMYCKSCNSYIDDDMGFCPSCGTPVDPVEGVPNPGDYQFNPNIRCVRCGYNNQPGSTYCNGCGAPLFPGTVQNKKISGAVIALICIGAVALIGCTIVALIIFGPFGLGHNDPDPTEAVTEVVVTEAPTAEPTPEPTPAPTAEQRREPPPPPPAEPDRSMEYVPTYSYYSKTVSSYSFSCDYPSDFYSVRTPGSESWVSYALEAPDGTGHIYIGGASGRSASDAVAGFLETPGYGGTVLANDQVDGSYCRIKTINAAGYHYAYFRLTGNMVRGFEVHYASDQDTRYSRYISHMESALYCY